MLPLHAASQLQLQGGQGSISPACARPHLERQQGGQQARDEGQRQRQPRPRRTLRQLGAAGAQGLANAYGPGHADAEKDGKAAGRGAGGTPLAGLPQQ